MKFVLDSSIGLKWVLSEANSARAARLRIEYNTGIHELVAPDIFVSEIASGLVVAERSRRIQPGEAAIFFSDVMSNAPVMYPSLPLMTRAMEISLSTRQGVYDCIYIALAEAEGCQMVSGDELLIRKLQPTFPLLIGSQTFLNQTSLRSGGLRTARLRRLRIAAKHRRRFACASFRFSHC